MQMQISKSTILSLISCVGVVVTAALAVNCYKKTDENDDIPTTAKKYLLAIISGGATIGCILTADRLNAAKIATLTGAVAYFGQRLKNYEKTVREVVGDENADEIQKKFQTKELEQRVPKYLLEDENSFIFIDKYSGAPIVASYEDVETGLRKCEETYRTQEYLCWCDMFFLINGSTDAYESSIGEDLGWSKWMYEQLYNDREEAEIDLKFNLVQLDDRKYLIDYNHFPEMGFINY